MAKGHKKAIYSGLFFVLFPLVGAFGWLALSESGLRWLFHQLEMRLPGELQIANLSGRLIGPIKASNIEYRLEGSLITAEQAVLDWRPSTLLMAQLNISHLHLTSLQIQSQPVETPDQAFALPEITLPLTLALEDLIIDNLTVTQAEQNTNIKQIRLKAAMLSSQLNISELSVDGNQFNFTLGGELQTTQNYRHEIEAHWQAQLPSSVVIEGQGTLKGDVESTHLIQNLSGPLQLTFKASLHHILEQFNWQARLDASHFDTAQLDAEWPLISGRLIVEGEGDLRSAKLSGEIQGNYADTVPFNGQIAAQWLDENILLIDHLTLQAPQTNTIIHTRGEWVPGTDGGDINLALHWSNLRWPLYDVAWFNSEIGSGWLAGKLTHYQFALATDRPVEQAPPSDWYLASTGDSNGLLVHLLRVTTLEGEANTKGQLSWLPQFAWQADMAAQDINPAAYWPEWPGQLKARLSSRGQLENGHLSAEVNIEQLSGTLRAYPVNLRSRLDWRDAGIEIKHFNFSSGASRINVKGRVGQQLNLDWLISTNDLGEFFPKAKGQLEAEGQFSGERDSPLVRASFKGKALRLATNEIGTVEGNLDLDLDKWENFDVKLSAEGLNFDGNEFQSLEFIADTQHMQARLISESTKASFEFIGNVKSRGWRGRIENARIQSERFDDWQLIAPAALQFNLETLLLERTCLHSKHSKLCATLERRNDNWNSELEIDQLPLSLVSPLLPVVLDFDGTANVKASIQFQAAEKLLGQLRLELSPGVVSYSILEGEFHRWEYRKGTMLIKLDNAGLEASTELIIKNGDYLEAHLSLPGAKLFDLNSQQQPLQAAFRVSTRDLGLIEVVVPEIQNLTGEVKLDFLIEGTLAQPRVRGQAHVVNGTFRIPRLGLLIDELNMQGQSEGEEKFRYRLTARSGGGTINVTGETRLSVAGTWPSNVSIKGDKFEVSRIPEAQVLVSPDLKIEFQQRTIRIEGGVHIPFAKLQPPDTSGAVRNSQDVVVMGGDEVLVAESWPVFAKIRLTLGERVHFFGFGFDGRFGGGLLLEDEPGQLTRATGEINVPEGRYRAYGQRLDVEHGRLLYTSGPLSNPGLDMRAVRRVGKVTAGLKVRGSLNQPEVELFSIPAMGQTDALSYLLLGRPIENASGEDGAMVAKAALALGLQGGDRLARFLGNRFGIDEMRIESDDTGQQASLAIGRYLSPKLYVSYGIGLVESVNTFNVRYTISDNWLLRGSSGEHRGADLLYTIEQ